MLAVISSAARVRLLRTSRKGKETPSLVFQGCSTYDSNIALRSSSHSGCFNFPVNLRCMPSRELVRTYSDNVALEM